MGALEPGGGCGKLQGHDCESSTYFTVHSGNLLAQPGEQFLLGSDLDGISLVVQSTEGNKKKENQKTEKERREHDSFFHCPSYVKSINRTQKPDGKI
jgi:hypothetical protein